MKPELFKGEVTFFKPSNGDVTTKSEEIFPKNITIDYPHTTYKTGRTEWKLNQK